MTQFIGVPTTDIDLRNTKTEKCRWGYVVWKNFEEPHFLVVYSTSMQGNHDLPVQVVDLQ